MGILSKRSIIFVILFLFFAACGGGDGKNGINNNLSNETLIKKGRVVDGYLKGANVCIDINSNLKCDNSEPSTKTKEDGSYLLKYSSSISNELSLIAYGGVDTSTNQPFNSLLKAPLKYENITPITTLIDYQRKVEGSLKKAEESVAKLFNIPKDELLDDPILRAKVDKKLFKTSLKIQKIVDLISSLNPSNKRDLKKIDRLFERIAKISSKTQNFIDATIEAAKDDTNISEDNLKDTLLTLDSIIEDSADSNESIADIEAKVHIAKSEIQKSIKEKKKIDKDEIEDKIKECRKDNLDNCIKDYSDKKEQKDNKNQDNKGNNNHKQQKGKKDNNQGKDSGDSNSSNNKDTTPPNIILNGDKEIKVILGDSYKELGARAIDNKDGEVNVTIISYVDDKNLGDYNVTYIAKDSAGNKAQKIRIVKVVSPKVLVSNLNISKEECQSWREIKVYPYKSSYFYTLNNNDWGRGYLDKNSTGVQCIFKFQKGNREFGGWYWGWPDNRDYQVKGYPEAIYGAKFRRIRNKNSGFPALVRSIDSIIVDMGYIDKGITKNYNIALEFWLHTDKNTSMNNIEYEIMFRFDPKGFHPNRIKIGEYEIDGVIYDVYTNNRYNGKIERRFINFVAHQKVKRIHVDFKKVLDYLTELEFDDIPDRYMSGIEMGVEVINGRGVFILDQLDVNLRLKDNQQNSLVNLEVGDPFEKRYKRKANYSLKNAPKGMRILNGGLLTWTPTKSQVGDFNITVMENNKVIDNLILKVKDKDITINGYFVDPTASANGDGSEENPFNNFKDACKVAKGGDSLYIRGGVYKSADYGKFIKRPARFINISGCIGEENNPITIRPWGNELVKLQSNGLNVIKVKNGSKYVVIQNFEVEGIAKDLNQSIVASQWWDESDYVKSGGISIGADYITVKDCIVHDMPGVGISSTKSKYTTIEGNIVYNCDWWTIAGSHGVGITQAKEDEDNPSEGKFYNKITNNLMFNIEQRIFSRVWSKGFSNLTIDEGEAFLIQENSSNYKGRYLIENNLLLFNGKSGVVNLAKNVTIKNNSYYANGTNTAQAGFRINKSPGCELFNNAIDAPLNKKAYSVGGDNIPVAKDNYVYGSEQSSFIEGIIKVDTPIFKDPQNFDFTINSSLPQDIGLDKATLEKFKRVIKDYAIEVVPTNYEVNRSLLTQQIIDSMPEGTKVIKFDDSDSKVAKLYIVLPDTHIVTRLRGEGNFTLIIPKENLKGVKIPKPSN